VSGEILIQPTAALKANLRGQRILVRGSIAGDLVALQAIHLEAGARVVGSLQAPAIAIGEGALIRGRVETSPLEDSTAQRAPAPAIHRAPSPPARTEPDRTPSRQESARYEPVPRREPPRVEASRADSRREIALGIDPPRADVPRTEASRPAGPLPPPRPAPSAASPRLPPPPPIPTLPTLSPPARPLPPPPPPAHAEATVASEPEEDPQEPNNGPPPPVVPALKKGIRGAMKQRHR
ncbi:MAG: polymer-forming cytoskeletal protein, partial [Myxococcales bacterium]|nr:polymer-forming cytoskeletal protein [Polyangiaceae bacterium]MDW8250092.1 polymer-forming cytoskeletal protein [Myxococcales bacterium]